MRIIATSAAILLSVTAFSQQVSPPGPFLAPEEELEAEELRRYSVEVIVFEYAEGVATGEEVFLPDPPPERPPDEPVLEYLQLPDYRAERAALQNYEDVVIEEISLHGPLELFMTGPEELTMTDIYAKLERLDAYKPILHGGWTQTTIDREQARPIRLRTLGDPPLNLDGSLTLYLSRYLHLIVDLALQDRNSVSPQGDPFDDDIVYYGDAGRQNQFEYPGISTPQSGSVHFRIFEDRIFRNGEVRYFDHPKFGVIAKVTRYEVDETEQLIETDEEFLAPVAEPDASDVGT